MYDIRTTSDVEALVENEKEPSKPVNVPSVVPFIDTFAPINGSFVVPSTTTPDTNDCEKEVNEQFLSLYYLKFIDFNKLLCS